MLLPPCGADRANRGFGFPTEFNSRNFNATGSYVSVVLVAFSVTLTEILRRVQVIASTRRN
jgi:hypothetical protein